jgi:geranylgeranyl diphosphate synthase type II
MMDFKSILAANKDRIWQEIQIHLPATGPFDFVEMVTDYPRRQGKYGRGTLVLLSCEAFGGQVARAVRTAAAMQLSEDWLLIHDDLEDDSDERRGQPTLHRLHGIEMATNAGDVLHILMWQVLIANRAILDETTTFRILQEFARFLTITATGQHFEMALFLKKRIPLTSLEYTHVEEIMRTKSAIYSIAGPIRLGAIIAGASEATLDQIDEFSIPLGIGFQIRDDLLNIIGNGSVYGKEIGGDLYEGKRTLLLVHLLKNISGPDQQAVSAIMAKPRSRKTVAEVQYIIDLMKKSGSIAFAETRAAELAREAKNAFNRHFSGLAHKESFEAAIEFFTMKRDH